MEIFNFKPIRLLEYVAVKDNFDYANQPTAYGPEFGFTAKSMTSLNEMFVEFSLYCHGGFDNHLVFSYKSCASFNFVSEGFDEDVRSLVHFIENYYNHTELFLEQFGVITQQRIEELMGVNTPSFKKIANIAIDNIRLNNITIR